MRFKKGSAAAKAFMAKLRAAKGKPKKAAAKKKAIGANYSMFSKEGNKKVTELVKHAKAKKLNRLQVSQKLHTLANTYPEALDTAVREDVYEAIFVKTTPKKKIGAVKKKAAPKKKAAVRNYGSHKDTASHNVKISVVSGIGSIMTHFKDQYGKLASKKLMEKTKREKNKIAKEMSVIAAKIKKLKNFLA